MHTYILLYFIQGMLHAFCLHAVTLLFTSRSTRAIRFGYDVDISRNSSLLKPICSSTMSFTPPHFKNDLKSDLLPRRMDKLTRVDLSTIHSSAEDWVRKSKNQKLHVVSRIVCCLATLGSNKIRINVKPIPS